MIVNKNGDTFQTLYEQFKSVSAAARIMGRTLAAAAPHGRNYQLDPDNYAFDRSTFDEALAGMAKVNKFISLLEAELAANLKSEVN